jgi:hypothetical protein
MKETCGAALIALAVMLSPWATVVVQAGQDDPIVLSGTLVKLDLEQLRGQLTTDLGKPVFFDVPKAYLFENVTVGARITVQLDAYGRAVKVMDTSLPDLLMIPATLPAAPTVQPLTATLSESLMTILEERH